MNAPKPVAGNGLKPWLNLLVQGSSLSFDEAFAAFGVMMSGEATMAQMGALLMALRLRRETAAEIAGAAAAMLHHMVGLNAPADAMDIVGTGGDQSGSLNISTAAALVVAACGVTVAKHGNRAASSKSGSADVLASLGIDLDRPIGDVEAAIAKHGFGFMLAQNHHKAVRNVMPARVELGFPTIFNFLGPLCNPAKVTRCLIGCFDPHYVPLMAEALRQLGITKAWVVHGRTGDDRPLDEISLAAPTQVCEIVNGTIKQFTFKPEDAGLVTKTKANIAGGTAEDNAAAIVALLQGERNDYRDIVLLNAAAALVIADAAGDLTQGVIMAAKAIDDGAGLVLLNHLRQTLGRA